MRSETVSTKNGQTVREDLMTYRKCLPHWVYPENIAEISQWNGP